MDKNSLRRIRDNVLRDLGDFIPKPSPYIPIHFPGYTNPADWDVANHIKIKENVNPQLFSLRQNDALSLFYCIIAFADAEENERNYRGTDLEEKEFNENYIKERWSYLEKALKRYVMHLTPHEENILLNDCDKSLTAESIDLAKTKNGGIELEQSVVGKKGRSNRQIDAILQQAKAFKYNPLSIPYGGKIKIKNECLKK